MQHKLNLRMAKWAVVEGTDLLLVGSVFAGATQPELIVHKRASTHNARWKLRVTVRTNLAPRGGEEGVKKCHIQLHLRGY